MADALGASVAELFAGIDRFHSALDYHLDRHNILTSNIAHVDTPGYVPRDLDRVDAGQFAEAMHVALTATQPGHLRGEASAASGRVFEDPAAGAGNDGNYVSLDREAAKIGANQLRYDVVSVLASAELQDLAFAATDGRGG